MPRATELEVREYVLCYRAVLTGCAREYGTKGEEAAAEFAHRYARLNPWKADRIARALTGASRHDLFLFQVCRAEADTYGSVLQRSASVFTPSAPEPA